MIARVEYEPQPTPPMATYLVIGTGDQGKSPARFTDLDQALLFARGYAVAGIAASVYYEIVSFSPEQFMKGDQ